ncbi:protein containing Outer membrane protein, OmpA/MotB, partial [Candidatus Magnetomorum sp. HK-1]
HGKWYLHVRAKDRANNESQVLTVYAIMDNTPPTIKGLTDDNNPSQTKTWQWTGLDTDREISYRYLIDQSPDSVPQGSFNKTKKTMISEGDGLWYIHVQARDRAGNISLVYSASALLDNSRSIIYGLSDDNIPKKKKFWTWTTNDKNDSTLYRYQISKTLEPLISGNFSKIKEAKIISGDGLYYLSVQAKDRAGNISDIKTVSAVLDNTKPEIKGLSNDLSPKQSTVWTWHADDADDILLYRYLIDQKAQANLSGSFTNVTMAAIKDKDGVWLINVQATDRAGNISKVYSASTLMDNTPPVFDKIIDDIIPRKVKHWKWNAKDADSQITYRYKVDQFPDTVPSGTFTDIKGTDLSNVEGKWYLHIQAKDSASNISDVKTVFATMSTKKKGYYYDLKIQFYASSVKPIKYYRVDYFGDILATYPDSYAVIEAHTDNVGDDAYNLKLSQRRADYVRNYLIKTYKIPPYRLKANGYGETRPIASNDTEEGRQKNRRAGATIYIDYNYKNNE